MIFVSLVARCYYHNSCFHVGKLSMLSHCYHYDCTTLRVIECMLMFVRSICLSIFLLFSIFDRCNLPLDEFGVKPGTLGTLLPSVVVPQQAEQLLVEPTLVSVQKRASISKVMSAFRQLNKQRRKANANSVRRPHCSHLLCAYVHLMFTWAMTPCHDLCIAFKNHTEGVMLLHMWANPLLTNTDVFFHDSF